MAFPFLQHCLELSYAWIFNEYPSFVEEDSRRFVSQETGHLYIAKVEPSDVGNYTCVVTSSGTAARVLGAPTPLLLRPDGTPRGAGPPEGALCARTRTAGRASGAGGGATWRVAMAVLPFTGAVTDLAPSPTGLSVLSTSSSSVV